MPSWTFLTMLLPSSRSYSSRYCSLLSPGTGRSGARRCTRRRCRPAAAAAVAAAPFSDRVRPTSLAVMPSSRLSAAICRRRAVDLEVATRGPPRSCRSRPSASVDLFSAVGATRYAFSGSRAAMAAGAANASANSVASATLVRLPIVPSQEYVGRCPLAPFVRCAAMYRPLQVRRGWLGSGPHGVRDAPLRGRRRRRDDRAGPAGDAQRAVRRRCSTSCSPRSRRRGRTPRCAAWC